MWRDDIGFFAPGGVMASDEGMEALQARSIARARQALGRVRSEGTALSLDRRVFPAHLALAVAHPGR